MCRKELLVVISCLVKEWRGYFVVCAWLYWEEDRKWRTSGGGPGVGQLYQHYHHHGGSNSHDEDITDQAINEWLDNFGDDELLREENRVLLSSLFTILLSCSIFQPTHIKKWQLMLKPLWIILWHYFSSRHSLDGVIVITHAPLAPIDRRQSPCFLAAPESVRASNLSPHHLLQSSPALPSSSFGKPQ